MKRIVAILVCAWMVLGIAIAESAPISEQDAVKIARDRFLETSELSMEDVDLFHASCSYSTAVLPELGDSRWMVELIYEACDGAVASSFNILISPDGSEILREDDTQEVVQRYYDIRNCEAALDAQRRMEVEKGPFRDWSQADQQVFIQEYGDVTDTLIELELPVQTDLQYWEIEEYAVSCLIEHGMTQDEINKMGVKCDYVAFFPPVGWVVTFTDNVSGGEIVITLYPENGQIIRTEIQEPSTAQFFDE